MESKKQVAYFQKDMDPNPLTENIDGMWITRSEPYRVVRVWQTDSERPKLSEEPPEIQAYAATMAHLLFEFKELE